MTTTQGKIWGTTQGVFAHNDVSVHRIDAVAGGYCSRHRHAHKSNLFFVESGRLRVTVWRGPTIDISEIGPGESTVVAPGLWHRFEAVEKTVAYEIYWAALDEDDIERDDTGGVND